MANLKSSKKDVRRTIRRTERNRRAKSRIKTLRKGLLQSDATSAPRALQELSAALDKGAKTNLLHRNKANRLKSRAARLATRLSASAESAS